MNLRVCALIASMLAPTLQRMPPLLIGTWNVGRPFYIPGPIGVDKKEERLIRATQITYATEHLRVCGKDVPAESIRVDSLGTNEFLGKYGFMPSVIGLSTATVTEVTVSTAHPANVCTLNGVNDAPGAHVFMDDNEHVVIEVGNAYYRLIKRMKT